MTEYKDLADSLNKEKDLIPRARRIFNNLSAIESILNRGITVNSLAIVLSNNGFEITFEQLKNGIYQARKKKKKQGDIQKDIKPAQSPLKSNTQKDELTESPMLENGNTQVNTSTPQKTQREKPKTLAEIRAETDAFFKVSQAKPSAAVQRQIDKLNKQIAERKAKELNNSDSSKTIES